MPGNLLPAVFHDLNFDNRIRDTRRSGNWWVFGFEGRTAMPGRLRYFFGVGGLPERRLVGFWFRREGCSDRAVEDFYSSV